MSGSYDRQVSLNKIPLLLLSLLVTVLLPHWPFWGQSIAGDNDVFAYIGWGMSKGKIPYLDLWDHKGPLLYLLERLGPILSSRPAVGVGILDILVFIITTYILLSIITQIISARATIAVALASIVFCAVYMGGGNITETWAVMFLAMAHLVAWKAANNDLPWYGGLLVGFSLAAAYSGRCGQAIPFDVGT
jgi:hypothetical protein